MTGLMVGSGGGGGSTHTWGEAVTVAGPSISGMTVFSIVLSFVLGALIVLTIFLWAKRAGHLSVPPVSQVTMRKYRDDLPE